jgi:hypothetical protein
MNIRTSIESKRGCGYRAEGGLYLVCEGEGRYCGALPIALDVCPTCHHGIHPARGWTWIDLHAIRGTKPCVQSVGPNYCDSCSMNYIGMVGLLWVGEKYYKTPRDFEKEIHTMGVSRRISQIPKQFEVGKTWVALAHRKAIQLPDSVPVEDKNGQVSFEFQYKAGIFHVYRPTAIEYVVREKDSKKKLESLEKRGISLVKVIRKQEEKAA